jgi:hypothetical protein
MKCLCHKEKQVSIEISYFVDVCKLFLLSYVIAVDVLFETRGKIYWIIRFAFRRFVIRLIFLIFLPETPQLWLI